MTRETKVGLMMVALLVGVFGFLLYKRVHRPLEGLATQDSTDVRATDRDDAVDGTDVIPRRDEDDSISFGKPRTKKNDRAAISKRRSDDDFAPKLPEGEDEFAEPTPLRQRLKPPVASRSDEDVFEQFTERPAPKKAGPRELPMEPAESAFDEIAPAKHKNSRVVVQVAANSESDPFSSDNSESEANEQETPFTETETPARTLSVPAAIDDAVEANDPQFDSAERAAPLNLKQPRRMDPTPASDVSGHRRSSESKANRAGRPALVQQTSDFENGLEPAPREERRPAPMTFEDRSFSPEGSPRSSVSGPNYVIEPNDNFWSISRKRYGVGRYYMALARHNEQVIPDPKRMKPGVAISTPDVALLEQRYADLIPKPAPADPAPSVVTTQSRKTENAGPAGFFVSADGVPMYRITGQDTLSEIAKSHLGRSSRWVQILEMNRNVLRDGNELKIGTVLRLPADASRVQVVGTPREFR